MFDEAERAVQAVRGMGEVDRACLLHPPSDSDRQLYEVLTDSVALYLARCRGEKRLDQKTVKAYCCDIEQFLVWLEEGIREFSRASMREYMVYLNARYAASTVRRKLASLRAWATWMRREDFMAASPFDDLDVSIRQPLLLPRTIGPRDLRHMLEPNGAAGISKEGHAPTMLELRDQAVLELLIATGIRVSELCALNLDSVDLSARQIRIFASESAPKHPTKVTNGVKGMENYVELDPSLVDLAFDSAASGSQLFDKPGSYTFKATVDNTDGNFVYENGPRSKTVSKVAAYADFKYGDAALEDSYFVNLDKKQSFDLDSVKAYNGKKEAKGVTVSAVKADGTTAASGELGAGTWTVTVKVDAKANDYAVGGTKTFTVKVVRASLDADANVFVYYKNEAVTSIEKTYDKKAIAKTDFTVKAFKDDNTDVSDKVSFNIYDEDGKKVDKIVDAGTYTLKIETDELELTGTTEITITVNKVDLSKLYVMQEKKWFDEESGAPYVPLASDGKSLGFNTVLGYDTQAELTTDKDSASDGMGIDQIGRSIAGKDFTPQVKAERYDVKKGKWVKVSYPNIFTVAGEYRFTLTGTADDAKNYKFANADNTTVVTTLCVDEKDLVFRDVLPGEWYFDAVADAKGLGYVAGVSGSKYYQPTAAIKRCDVIVILARMAGVDTSLNGMTEDEFSKVYGTYLDYNDVDESSYYARALAWATKVDIAHGSNGAFRPNDTITREEFAALLSNYAMLNGKDVSVDADKVLAGFPDGSSVSDWAADAVAWAADADIMGNGGKLNPGSDITRAEVAAMAVNFQPEKIAKPVK